jgi:UDP-N-acetylmuramate dehydrogenase
MNATGRRTDVPESCQPLRDVPLAPLTTLGVGGGARWYARANSAASAAAAVAWAAERDLPLVVVGGGSNLIVADDGWPGLVLHVAINGIEVSEGGDATRLVAGAGEAWDGLVSLAVSRGLAGIECLSGIPGTVGGTPVQNVGAYGQEVADVIDHVTILDRTSGALLDLAARDCGFGYRMSRFKGADAGRFVVCAVTFRLMAGRPTVVYPDVVAHMRQRAIMDPTLADVREAVLLIRRQKGMVVDAADPDTRSVGSFFVNPVLPAERFATLKDTAGGAVPSFAVDGGRVKVPAAWLIERAGFPKGFAAGAAGISSKHPLALVNRGGATAREIVALGARIKREVADRFGVWLKAEPVFVGGEDNPDVAYLQKAQD